MFSTKAQLKRRTPENGTDRENFLSSLVDEYLRSNSYEAKCQVLANLANFAYDPINYEYIRDVGVLDIFLHVLKHEDNQKLLQFSCAGICNLCIDPVNAEYILKNCRIQPIIVLIESNNHDIVADVITILIYLSSNRSIPELTSSETIKLMDSLKNSDNRKLSNLAKIFLKDVCGRE